MPDQVQTYLPEINLGGAPKAPRGTAIQEVGVPHREPFGNDFGPYWNERETRLTAEAVELYHEMRMDSIESEARTLETLGRVNSIPEQVPITVITGQQDTAGQADMEDVSQYPHSKAYRIEFPTQIPQALQKAATKFVQDAHRSGSGAKAVLEALLEALEADTQGHGRFVLRTSLLCVSIRSMTGDLTNREQRIDAMAVHLREVASELPDVEEQREAEVKALVESVPRQANFAKQVKDFSGISHLMRVLIARQLETPFREHLRDDSPRIDGTIENRNARNADLAERKSTFADLVTDSVLQLGIGITWDGVESKCYMTSAAKPPQNRGTYRIRPCVLGENGGEIVDWFADPTSQTRATPAAVDALLNRIGLADLLEGSKLSRLFSRRR